MSNIVLLYHPAPLLPEGGDHRPTSSRRGRPPCLPEQGGIASRDLEPLDKGRLSLGDVGDAFRAKRGKNAGIAPREIYQKSDSKFNKMFLLHGFKDNTNRSALPLS